MNEKLRIEWKILLYWIIANYFGVGFIGVIRMVPLLTSVRGIFITSFLIGFPIGLAQWLALRKIAPVSVLWAFTIFLGLYIGTSLSSRGLWGLLGDETIVGLSVALAADGLIAGFAQWFLLRRQFHNSLVWILSSTFGIGSGVALVLLSNLINQGLVAIFLVTILYSSLTGLTISWLSVSNS